MREVLWLGRGIEGDDTDGHIDDLARFVRERVVVTVVEEKRDSPNYEALQENLARLRSMKIEGKPLEVFELPMPRRIVREDLVLPASYANFYIANTLRFAANVRRSDGRTGARNAAKIISGSQSDRDRLPRINLGPGHVSLPDPATAGSSVTISHPRPAPVCNRSPRSRRADRAGGFFGHQTLRSLAHALYLPGRRTLQGCA